MLWISKHACASRDVVPGIVLCNNGQVVCGRMDEG